MLQNLLKLRLYLVFVLLVLGGFVWAGLTGTRLLGDDNESTERINGSPGRSSGGRSGYYHK